MIIRALLLALLFYLGYTLFSAVRRSLDRPSAPPPEKSAAGEDMVQDPECGIFVPRGDSLSSAIKGHRHYFCSQQCLDNYKKSQSSKEQQS